MRRRPGLVMLWMLSAALRCNCASPPGKPVLLGCRSPEKETFTCWWEPGSDGGLPTVHRLYYERENLDGIHECSDYHSAGENSCFFGKDQTSIWVEYTLTVVAFSALGNTSSDPYKIDDVMKIVKPYAPENVTVLVNETANSPYLHASWNPPRKADTKSGWATIDYELRVKKTDENTWETYQNGIHNFRKLYNMDPGATYMVEVRCRLDHSSWSEWSSTSSVKLPNYFQNEKPFWILVSTFSIIPLLAIVCILVLKRKFVKQWLLPPVPGPKIRGVDVQLLKNGRSEDVVNTLMGSQSFPPTTPWMDQTEEYLLVSDSNDWLLTDPYRSQKKKSLMIPAGAHLEIQCRESAPGQSDCEKAAKGETDHLVKTSEAPSKESSSDAELALLPPEEQRSPSRSHASKENTNQPVAATSYVDIHQQENTEWDYSRVKEVNGEAVLIFRNENVPVSSAAQRQEGCAEDGEPATYSVVKEVDDDNVVLLHKHDSAESFCKKEEDRSTEWTNQKTKLPHATDCSKVTALQITGDGYVM